MLADVLTILSALASSGGTNFVLLLIAGLLGWVVYLQFQTKRKQAELAENHLHDVTNTLERMEGSLNRIEDALLASIDTARTRQEAIMVQLAIIQARINGRPLS